MNQPPTLIENVSPKLYSTPLAAYPAAASFAAYSAFVLNREAARAARAVRQ